MSGGEGGRIRRYALSASLLLYRQLLRLRYPAPLCQRFGADMEALFRLMLAEELERGTLRGLVRAWWRAVRACARWPRAC